MSREMSNHFDIKLGVERMDSITSSIRHLQSSNHTQSGRKMLSCIPAENLKWWAGNWTVPTQEITALCQNLQEKHVFKFAVRASLIWSESERGRNYRRRVISAQDSVRGSWGQQEVIAGSKALAEGSFLPINIYVSYKTRLCTLCLVAQLCPTLCNPMDAWSTPGSSVHGTAQERVLEWAVLRTPGDLPSPEVEHPRGSCNGRLIVYH